MVDQAERESYGSEGSSSDDTEQLDEEEKEEKEKEGEMEIKRKQQKNGRPYKVCMHTPTLSQTETFFAGAGGTGKREKGNSSQII